MTDTYAIRMILSANSMPHADALSLSELRGLELLEKISDLIHRGRYDLARALNDLEIRRRRDAKMVELIVDKRGEGGMESYGIAARLYMIDGSSFWQMEQVTKPEMHSGFGEYALRDLVRRLGGQVADNILPEIMRLFHARKKGAGLDD